MSLIIGNALDILPTLAAASINCVVTSPPYWGLRDYGTDGQLGLEPTPDEYVANLVAVFREVWRVLRDDGTLWLNLGDSYASYRDQKCVPQTVSGDQRSMPTAGASNRGSAAFAGGPVKHKDLVGIPWRVAFALQADGWYLRSDIIWAKPNPMPESVTDRPTKAHEYVFLLTKAARYWYDADAIKETNSSPSQLEHNQKYAKPYAAYDDRAADTGQPGNVNNVGIHGRGASEGRNRRTVWTIATQPYPEAHFATYPEKLVEPCVLAGCPVGGTVLDPFAGSGTTGAVAYRLGRNFVGIELNREYAEMAERRIAPHRDQMQLAVT